MSKILVIDDDSGIQDALAAILEFDGHEVQLEVSDERVLTMEDRELPDLIILDLLLSGKDGKTIAKGFKNNDRLKHIPIIMLSAHPSAQQSALESGADDFLAKPFDMDVLLKKVRSNLKDDR
ncbi:MAG: Response regulator receiver [uncultured bacterium]|uniref:Response regulator receiver protein n=3 Tax=Candidatus Daviesiibacteriota TaxID=1752718 RepID=A0A0G0HD25_9BACT|nr:MAG: Response regulator receiver [uncultured bacterium]KKQ10014.1 MAG: Response regulator receiver protein [Candidatus Daviesbacteria bacterium GW2011_GWB1_36_5]KKQ14701.1 MAG: Response regulator receiver protein [Candidatus Daviesbacteria bacterium GW2011_GWA1_36_8]OGE33011.1 MAG: hypothetical protein A3C99_00670 [Candidatus Daviesbacteria bacterium RIFCSPHIGHO2_02_FULL_37_9]OGE36693.1 MAG: hypothetical protein A3E66_02055 [Candidatus Daviesbacteria bacterium RIFCSPHIGHO2_12_FULL_37_16]